MTDFEFFALSPEEQAREDCLYMRYYGGRSYFDSENGTLWYKLWNGPKVFYGHIAEASCPVLPKTVSLDGGCVFGDYLKAWDSKTDTIYYAKAKQAYSLSEFAATQGTPHEEVRKREELCVAGLLRKDMTDDGRYAIYTYTDQCTFDGAWDNITRNSRGHIFVERYHLCLPLLRPSHGHLGLAQPVHGRQDHR